MRVKGFFLFLFGGVVGGFIVTTLTFYQISTRYMMGVNTGYIHGGNTIIQFLEKHIINENTTKEVTVSSVFLDHKSSRITVIDIDGIKTIRIE